MRDLTGQRFGKLTVIECTGRNKSGRFMWKCECDCGNVTTVRADGLTRGHTKSCGCLIVVAAKNRIKDLNKIHGKTNTRLFHIWQSMRSRCSNPSNKNYPRYGGRGIRVCDEWEKDFVAFYNWAMDNGYQEDLTLDREDNSGNYEPSNCKWATPIEQANNTRRNVYMEYNGEVHTMKEWSRIIGINYCTLQKRIKLGWTIEKALTEPVKNR